MSLSLAVCASRGFSHFVRPFGCAGGFEAARGASSVSLVACGGHRRESGRPVRRGFDSRELLEYTYVYGRVGACVP